MDNGNDLPARILFLEISDEKHDSNSGLMFVFMHVCSAQSTVYDVTI